MEENRAHHQTQILVILLLLVFDKHVFSQNINPGTRITNIAISHFNCSSLPLKSEIVKETNQDDINGLQEIIRSFSQLQAWKGDPCLPNNTVWEWLRRNTEDPLRATSLYLSGYGLQGPIPDFKQMQTLEIINMDHNHLTGRIPHFLGNLTNLKLLLTSSRTSNSTESDNTEPQQNIKYSLNLLWCFLAILIVGSVTWWGCRFFCCLSSGY